MKSTAMVTSSRVSGLPVKPGLGYGVPRYR